MENPEEVLHSLEEFSKLRPRNIPRELEDYLRFVARTGDPVYQWPMVKSLFREKMANVVAEFREACPGIEVPPCPNVDPFNYESMRTFILERLDAFAAAPFTIQRICELLTAPRKEYNRIDKYMRALEKNVLVVSTTEPGNRRRGAENGDDDGEGEEAVTRKNPDALTGLVGIVNGLETSEHAEPATQTAAATADINVEEMDDAPVVWLRISHGEAHAQFAPSGATADFVAAAPVVEDFAADKVCVEGAGRDEREGAESSSSVICRSPEEPFVSIEPVAVAADTCLKEESVEPSDVTVTITAIPAVVQTRRSSTEPAPSEAVANVEVVVEEEEEVKKEMKLDAVSESTEPSVDMDLPHELSVITKEDKEADEATTVTASASEPIECTQEPEITSSKCEETECAIAEVIAASTVETKDEVTAAVVAEEETNEATKAIVIEEPAPAEVEVERKEATAGVDLKADLLKSESESDSQSSSSEFSSNESSLLEEPPHNVPAQHLDDNQVTSTAQETVAEPASQSHMDVEENVETDGTDSDLVS